MNSAMQLGANAYAEEFLYPSPCQLIENEDFLFRKKAP